MAHHPHPGHLNHPRAEGQCQVVQGAGDKITRYPIDHLGVVECHISGFESGTFLLPIQAH